jgi:hypothetical protein
LIRTQTPAELSFTRLNTSNIADTLSDKEVSMHKKLVIVSHLPRPLPGRPGSRPASRILLSRETIRTLTSEELSQVVGGGEPCENGSTTQT